LLLCGVVALQVAFPFQALDSVRKEAAAK